MNEFKNLQDKLVLQHQTNESDAEDFAISVTRGILDFLEKEKVFRPVANEVERVRIAFNRGIYDLALKLAGEIYLSKYPSSNGLDTLIEKVLKVKFLVA